MTKNNLPQCLGWLLQQDNSTNTLTPKHIVPIPSQEHSFGTDNDQLAIPEYEEMARLQFAPRSVTRPRLLANGDVSNAFPTPANSTSTANTSPKPPGVQSRTHSTPAAPKPAPIPTPMTDYGDNVVFDIEDLDDEDMLLDGNVTTSSFEHFGTPVKLWNEASAVRVEPTSSRGKKRKSSEYIEDLGSDRPLKHERLLTPKQETVTQIRESSTQRWVEQGLEYPMDQDEETYETINRQHKVNEQRHESSNAAVTRKSPAKHIQSVVAASPTQPTRATPVSARSRSRHRTQILDSEDDAEVIARSSPREVKKLQDDESDFGDKRDSIPASPLQRFEAPQTTTDDAPFDKWPKRQLSEVPMPSATSSSHELHQVTQTKEVQSVLPASSSSASDQALTDEEKQLVRRFCDRVQAAPDALSVTVKSKIKSLRSQIAHIMCDGGDTPKELEAALRNQRKKLEILPEIMKMTEPLQVLLNRQNDKKQELDSLLADHDDDDMDDDAVWDLSRHVFDLKVQITRLERPLLIELQQHDFSLEDLQIITPSLLTAETPISRPMKMPNKVLVASTQQAPKYRQPYADSPDGSNWGGDLPSIIQTPISRADEVSSRTYTEQHPRASRDVPSSALGYNQYSYNPPAQARSRDGDWPQQGYSRTMGSPAPASPLPVLDEEFGDDFGEDFDDNEMINAFETFEQSIQRKDREYSESRPALAEMSHNIQSVKERVEKPRPPPADLLRHPWSKDVMNALRKRFHLQEFRHNQLEAINATLAGQDIFVLMPTGGGKSLCYQLPSIVHSGRTEGVTIVVSPLLSLMQDQVDHLQKLKIQAFMINGDTSAEHKRLIFQSLEGPKPESFIQVLYVTPEMVGKSDAINNVFQNLHRRGKLARLVIDEAHCVSQWGHDFRPDYKKLGEFRAKFPGVPVMALTATATEMVKLDTITNLSIKGCRIFTQSFNRPNLTYTVLTKGKGAEVTKNIVETISGRHRGESGIIYCLSRKQCEKLAATLSQEHRIRAAHYHAGMSAADRVQVQKEWQKGNHDVIVATIAFGMGIDKPNVRYVIHHTIPKSLEGYYQETGRAGRDGKPSNCYLYYGYGDTTMLKKQITDGDGSPEQKDRQKTMLRNVIGFCENKSECRRYQVLDYFNERFDPVQCNNTCDNCMSDSVFEEKDFSNHAKHIIRLVRRICGDKVTLLHCVDVYRGGGGKKARDAGHDGVKEAGEGSSLDRSDVERLFYRLVTEDALELYHEVNGMGFPLEYLQLGRKCWDFESGKSKLSFQIRLGSTKKTKSTAANTKGRAKKGKTVAASEDESYYPPPTMISSPVESRKRAKKKKSTMPIVVSSESEDDDDGFEPIRRSDKPIRRKSFEPGPPITVDQRVTTLDEAHRSILGTFVDSTKKALHQIEMKLSLRQKLVSDTVLREIGIELPNTEAQLLRYNGITEQTLKLCGKLILGNISEARQNLAAMRAALGEESDEMDGSEGEDEGDDGVNTSSAYFTPPNDTSRLMQQLSQAPAFTTKASSRGRASSTRGAKSSTFRKYAKGKKRSGATSKSSRSTSTEKKKRTATSDGNSRAAASSASNKKSSSLFGMMPT